MIEMVWVHCGEVRSQTCPVLVRHGLRHRVHIGGPCGPQRAADPSSDLTGLAARDLDGEARIAPADIGADQLSR